MDKELLEKLDRTIDKINAFSEAAANRTLWQDINIAPRDGTNILGFKEGIMATVRWLREHEYWTLCVPGTFTLYHDWDPTHWMPLPPPPADDRSKSKRKGGKKK